MDGTSIAERRRLRRKLTFWRVAALVVVAAALFFAWRAILPSERDTRRDHVAQVTISGVIQDDRELLERLDRIARSSSAKALVVSISSPGGTTYGGERLYKALRQVADRKPVVSDVRTLAASAGYIVALAGDRIFAGETSITGSIGVLMQYPQAGELLEKIGVTVGEEKSSPLKAEPSPFHPASEEAKAMIRATIMDSYDWFVALVAERRGLPRETVLPIADGRIVTGRQALGLQLIDELGGDGEIRAYLDTRGVGTALPVVEWKTPSRGSVIPLLGSVMRLAGWASGEESLDPAAILREIRSRNLFLDGLLSVWQVGRD
ncbi:signal peptide peptidase SppA [Rhizobiaceae bacterium BDR2-2]|uniref:Signal peptide peptidase SppA n=1 Tax=Ectorhizobium quercum TaxID=2965071 RepID=A0AAE3MWM0_9HYPH|nr:signal peptide peptidase SppA [Ectorhizobium quercum]MCX8995766.1 signal peptide peptidase SppA [Ectorhizobium quercum]